MILVLYFSNANILLFSGNPPLSPGRLCCCCSQGLFKSVLDVHGRASEVRGESVACSSERDVFDFLGIPYRDPKDRETFT